MEYKIGELSQIEIQDADKRIVKGFIGTQRVDVAGHFIPEEAYRPAIEEWLTWGNIRDAHGTAVGNVVAHDMGKGWNYIEAVIVDDGVWKKIEKGVYKGFSIGAKVLEKTIVPFITVSEDMLSELPGIIRGALEKAGKLLRIDSLMIVEVSVTDRPVNQGAMFVKSMEADLPVLKSVLEMESEEKTMSENLNETQDETVVEDMTESQEIVENSNDAVTEENQTVDFDAQKSFGEMQSRLDSIESSMAQITQEFTQKLDEVTKSEAFTALEQRFESISTEVQKALGNIEELRQAMVKATEVVTEEVVVEDANKSMEVTEDGNVIVQPDLDKVVETAVKKTLESVFGSEAMMRKNLVNSGGETVEEEKVEKPGPLHEQYKNLAAVIARKIKP